MNVYLGRLNACGVSTAFFVMLVKGADTVGTFHQHHKGFSALCSRTNVFVMKET